MQNVEVTLPSLIAHRLEEHKSLRLGSSLTRGYIAEMDEAAMTERIQRANGFRPCLSIMPLMIAGNEVYGASHLSLQQRELLETSTTTILQTLMP
jgi:hypothetical protein